MQAIEPEELVLRDGTTRVKGRLVESAAVAVSACHGRLGKVM